MVEISFLVNTFLGDLISKTVEKVDRRVQKNFDSAEKKLEVLHEKGQIIGGSIDNIGLTLKSISRHGVHRDDMDSIYKEKNRIKEQLPKYIPLPQVIKKPLQIIDKTVDGINLINKSADKYHELKNKKS